MKLTCMISEIVYIIDTKYDKYVKEECIDVLRIKRLCTLYKPKSATTIVPVTGSKNANANVSLSDIVFSSPDISKISKNNNSNSVKQGKLNTPELHNTYALFIKLLYACLKLEIEIFTLSQKNNDTCCIIKNNYNLIKSIEASKKKLISEHIDTLQKQQKKISSTDIQKYESYSIDYITKLKIFDKLIRWINIFEKNDNLYSLVLPHFYTYTEYIEEYVG